MGRSFQKIYILTLLALFFLPLTALRAADESGIVAVFKDYMLPMYDAKTGKLQFVVYGKKAKNIGAVLDMDDVLIDLVSKDIKNISQINDYKGVKLYDIDVKAKDRKAFWKDKPSTRVLIQTPKAEFDRVTQKAKGNDEVHLRSPELDVDGVGFEADHKAQTIFIKSKVKVVLWQNVQAGTVTKKDDKKDKKKTESKAAEPEKKDKEDEKDEKK